MKASGLELESSVPLCKNVYLGCGQVEVEPDLALIREKLECYERVCYGAPSGKAESNVDELIDTSEATRDASSSPKQKSKKKSQQIANPWGSARSSECFCQEAQPEGSGLLL